MEEDDSKEKKMARYKVVDRSPRFLPIVLDAQLMAGSFEYALDYLIDHEIDLSGIARRYMNDQTGAPAYDSAVMLKIVLLPWRRLLMRNVGSPHDRTVVAFDICTGGGAMSNPKAEVVSMLEALPQDASLEDIQYHLYVLEKVKRGLERAESEGAISHEDAKVRLGKWLAA